MKSSPAGRAGIHAISRFRAKLGVAGLCPAASVISTGKPAPSAHTRATTRSEPDNAGADMEISGACCCAGAASRWISLCSRGRRPGGDGVDSALHLALGAVHGDAAQVHRRIAGEAVSEQIAMVDTEIFR